MKTPENQQDELLKSLFKEVEVKDDLELTEKVMHQIEEIPTSKASEYTPPISKTAWIIIALSFSAILAYSLVLAGSFSIDLPEYSINISQYFDQIKNSISIDVSLPELPKLSLPYLTAILAFNIIGMYFMLSYWRSKRV